jgi:hypothetical protein
VTPANYANGLIDSIYMMPYELDAITTIIGEHLPEDGKMVEWGSGGSTCKWLELISDQQKLITIESNHQWYARVDEATKLHFGEKENFQLLYRPERFDTGRVYGEITEEIPYGLDDYVNPSADIWDADIFFIDGLARSACFAATMLNHNKDNAIVLWHDYIGREGGYNWISQFFHVQHITGTLVMIKKEF